MYLVNRLRLVSDGCGRDNYMAKKDDLRDD